MKNNKATTINISAIFLLVIVLSVGYLALASLDNERSDNNFELITGDAIKQPINLEKNDGDKESDSSNKNSKEEIPDKNKSESRDRKQKGLNNKSKLKIKEKVSETNSGSKKNNKKSHSSNIGYREQKTFNAKSSKGKNKIKYEWDLGDGNKAFGPKVRHKYKPGSYNVTLTVIGSKGRKDNFTRTVTVMKTHQIKSDGSNSEKVSK